MGSYRLESLCFFINFVILGTMRMDSHKNNADFLHLFSEADNGLKYLTHDYIGEFDYVKDVYKCQRLILSKRAGMDINDGIFNLVRGFVFGPDWTDYKGEKHTFFLSSEEAVSYFETTGQHPLNAPSCVDDFEAFRNSIRFRSGILDKFFKEELKEEFPTLSIETTSALSEADFYTDTGALRSALRLILKSMLEYGEHPCVQVGYMDSEEEGDYQKSSIMLTQVGSFPSHPLSRDMARLKEGDGGTFGTIRKKLDGLCDWTVISRWPDCEKPTRWRILRNEIEPEVSPASVTIGFTHIISVYHRL